MVMNSQHLDIGTIQSFLDGELTHDGVDRVSSHIASCDNCAAMLGDAEDESAVVFPALAREFDTLVPTQRLWNKINDSIAAENDNVPFWKKASAFASLIFVNPSLSAAAGLLMVFGLAAIFWVNRTVPSNDIAYKNDRTPSTSVTTRVPVSDRPVAFSSEKPEVKMGDTVSVPLRNQPQIERASYQPEARKTVPVRADLRSTSNTVETETLPGEESYVRTIATLAKSVEGRKDGMMRPSERVAYERDMAVVDDSIAKMRKEVKKNPRNESAKQVLYTSYQNKIDLLNSVSQKEELMASLK